MKLFGNGKVRNAMLHPLFKGKRVYIERDFIFFYENAEKKGKYLVYIQIILTFAKSKRCLLPTK